MTDQTNAAQAAAQILTYLGFAQAVSMEPGADRRRDQIQGLIECAMLPTLRAPVASVEVMDALNWVDDFIARCNRDDRGSCESVNVLRRALASAAVADRQRLRELVDVVWNEATESTAVPDTPWADRLIDKVFPSLASAPVSCDHLFHYFGDQKERRCNRCNVTESKAIAPVAGEAARSREIRLAGPYPPANESSPIRESSSSPAANSNQ